MEGPYFNPTQNLTTREMKFTLHHKKTHILIQSTQG